MSLTEGEITNFLNTAGWGDAVRDAMNADASFRSYERLKRPSDQCAILMKAPPATNEPISIFARVTEILRGYALSAPEVYAQDDGSGLMLIEDLGDDLFAHLAENGTDDAPLYASAVDVLVSLHTHPVPEDIQPYDRATYLREANLLTDWYLPTAKGAPPDAQSVAVYEDHIQTATEALDGPPVLVLRDFHAENLLHLPDRSGIAAVGLLDYQDALAGHPAYDLVSLLEDARRDTSAALRETMIARYLTATKTDPTKFACAYATLGAQRNLKIIGIFSRLCLRDGKDRYIDMIPRVWAHLMRDLAHHDLSGLHSFVVENIPAPTPEILARLKAARAT